MRVCLWTSQLYLCCTFFCQAVIFALRTHSIVVQGISLFHWASSDLILPVMDLIALKSTAWRKKTCWDSLWSLIQIDFHRYIIINVIIQWFHTIMSWLVICRNWWFCRNWCFCKDIMLGTSAMNVAGLTRSSKECDSVFCAWAWTDKTSETIKIHDHSTTMVLKEKAVGILGVSITGWIFYKCRKSKLRMCFPQ